MPLFTACHVLVDQLGHDCLLKKMISMCLVLIGREGKIVYLDIIGVVSVSNKLSGTPEISLRFNDSSLIDTCIFHRCVRKSSWLNDSVVVCIPPDGTFKLMKYRYQLLHNKVALYLKKFARGSLCYYSDYLCMYVIILNLPGLPRKTSMCCQCM